MKELARRIYDISYKHKLSHIGSCLSSLPIIYDIYKKLRSQDVFINSCAHNSLALYVVLEHFGISELSAEELLVKHGIHCMRDEENGIRWSGGSLGHGLPAAVGFALADRSRDVYCLISDGECGEGSIWEALRIADDMSLRNLYVICNANGWGAYKKIEARKLGMQLNEIFPVYVFHSQSNFPGGKDLDAHYKVINEEEYKACVEDLES